MAAIVLTAPSSVDLIEGQSTSIGGISVSEDNAVAGEVFSLSLRAAVGPVLSIAGATSNTDVFGHTTYFISGSLSEVNDALATLVDTETSAGTDTIGITASDSFGNGAAQTISVNISPLVPVITAPSSVDLTEGQSTSIGGISVSEDNAVAGEVFSLSLRAAVGPVLSIAGATSNTDVFGHTTYFISGSLSEVNDALATLVDTETSAGTDTIGITASDSFGNGAAQTISVNISPLVPQGNRLNRMR